MTLTEKLAGIYTEVSRFAKSKAVTGTGPSFKYTPVEEIADQLREKMGQAGIVMIPSRIEVIASEDAGTTKSGTTRWRHVIRVEWTITDGENSLTVDSIGESMDTGDKGMNKAQTAARKYALIGAFQLSTGDDPDRSHPEPADYRRKATPRGPDTKALARELMETAGDQDALVEKLAEAKIASADLADPKKLAKAKEIAEAIRDAKPATTDEQLADELFGDDGKWVNEEREKVAAGRDADPDKGGS